MGEKSWLKYCRGCKYLSAEVTQYPCCVYILHTGHCRPCPVGEGCTVKDTGQKQHVGVEVVRKAWLNGQTYDSREKELKAYNRWYYEQNKEKILARNRAYKARKRAEKKGGAHGTGD